MRQPNYHGLRAFIEKRAKSEVSDRRNSVEGAVAGTIGRIHPDSLFGAALLAPTAPIRHLRGLDAQQAERLVAAADKDFGDDLDGVKVRVGGGDVIGDVRRVLARKDNTVLDKFVGVPVSIMAGGMTALSRGDHYNPFAHTVTSYSGDPAVLAHELGHAADFGKRKNMEGLAYRQGDAALKILGNTAAKAVGMSGAAGAAANAAAMPFTMFKEYQATKNALKGKALRREMASQYGASSEEDGAAQARNVLAPAYGTYTGASAAAGLALANKLSAPKANTLRKRITDATRGRRQALFPIAGALLGHAGARAYNAMSRTKEASILEEVAEKIRAEW